MTTPTMERPTAALPARDGFGPAVRAEWTKLRSVRSTAIMVFLAMALTVLLSMLAAYGSSTNAGSGPTYVDRFHFVHRPMSGDGSITVRVASQANSHESARAGIMIKSSVEQGTPYAAIMVTPGHGARMQSGFKPDVAGSPNGAPRWLRLTRTGSSVTGYESADGATWTPVATVQVALPSTAQAGLFVASPGKFRVVHYRNGSSTSGHDETVGRAVFDDVDVRTAAAPVPGQWSDQDVGTGPPPEMIPPGFTRSVPGTASESNGVFTVTGSGDIGSLPPGGNDDVVMNGLAGVYFGLIALMVLGVLFATSEFRTGLVRTTLTVVPRRAHVLAGKALVVGTVGLAAGLIGSVGAFFVVQPIQRSHGYVAPAYPPPSLTDPTVLRAVAGTAVVLALLAVFGLAVGTIVRRTAGALIVVLPLVLVPALISDALAPSTSAWLRRLVPTAGLAIQQTRDRWDTAIGPWQGLGVLAAYTAGALAMAFWLLRRRDA